MSNRFVILLAGLLLGLNAFANDALLPGFQLIARDLATPIEKVQALIPVFLIAAGIGQLISGPASDRFGRRPLLVSGLVLFAAGSAICALAGSIFALQVGRVVQGLGAAFGVVMARAMLRDTQSGKALARSMALAMAIFAFGPLAAPLVGVGFIALGGWRTMFGGVLAVGLALLALTVVRYQETHQNRDLRALEPARLAGAFGRVLSHPQSRRFLVVACLQQSLIITMISSSPRIFRNAFGVEGVMFAALFAVTALGIVVGQLTNHRIIARLGTVNAATAASALVTTSCVSMYAAHAFGAASLPLFVLQVALFNMGFLVVLANAASLMLDPHPDIAGLAASLFGFMTQVVGSTIALLTLGPIQGDLARWSMVLAALSAIVLGLLLVPVGRAVKSGR